MHPQKGTIAPTMRTLHCVYTRRLSEKVLTAMQFSINGKARQFETSAELSKILAEYRFVPIPIRTRLDMLFYPTMPYKAQGLLSDFQMTGANHYPMTIIQSKIVQFSFFLKVFGKLMGGNEVF